MTPPRHTPSLRRCLAAAALLLLVAAARMTHLGAMLNLTGDEAWSVWQTLGTPRDVLRWTPYDWPPGYYLLLWAWRSVAGVHPVAVRLLSVLLTLLGAAFLFRVAARLYGRDAAALAVALYGTAGFGVFAGLLVRGHALSLALAPLVLWLTVRHFARPSWRRGLLLGLGLAAMVSVHFSAAAFFVALGVFTLLHVPLAHVRRWLWPVAVLLIASAPLVASRMSLTLTRVAATQTITLPPDALPYFYADWAGRAPWLWAALGVLGVALLTVRARVLGARRVAAALAWLAWPAIMLLLNPLLGFFGARYIGWAFVGAALAVGWGLAQLPRAGRWAVTLALAATLALPLDFARYDFFTPPVGSLLAWLNTQPLSDTMLIADPHVHPANHGAEVWDVALRGFAPPGLTILPRDATPPPPDQVRGVWLLRDMRAFDPALAAAVAAGRVRAQFYGPPEFLAQFYLAPPDPAGQPVGDHLRIHGAELVLPHPQTVPVFHEGGHVRVRLWWSAPGGAPPLDYSLALRLLAPDGSVVLAADGPPQPVSLFAHDAAPPPFTSQWSPATLITTESVLALPNPLPRGAYTLAASVYFWEDATPLPTPAARADGLLPLLTLRVMSW